MGPDHPLKKNSLKTRPKAFFQKETRKDMARLKERLLRFLDWVGCSFKEESPSWKDRPISSHSSIIFRM